MDHTEQPKDKINVIAVAKDKNIADLCKVFASDPNFYFAGVADLSIIPENKKACDLSNIMYVNTLSQISEAGKADLIFCFADDAILQRVSNAHPQAIIFSGDVANTFLNSFIQSELNLQKTKDALVSQSTQLMETSKKVQALYNELEAKNKSLMEMDQLKTSFISMVSHELRTPITVIGEGMSLLADKILGELTPQQERIVKMTRDNVDRLGRIIAELLDISIIEAGRITLRRDTVDMRTVLKKIAQAFSNKIERSHLTLNVLVDDEPIIAYADSEKMSQVLMNLINNAIKFTPENGKIEVSLINKSGTITCSVKDTGRGIAEKEIPFIFDKFQQFGKEAGVLKKGMGLGLFLVKNIIELHGGRIWVESEQGEGSVFYFDLPAFATESLSMNKSIDDKINFISKIGESEFFTLLLVDLENLEYIYSKNNPDERERIKLMLKNTINESLEKQEDMIIGQDGSHFIIILSNTNKNGAKFVCKRISENLNNKKDKISNGIDIQTRFGFASYPFDGTDSKSLLESSELSLMRKRNIIVIDDDVSVTNKLSEIIAKAERFHCIEVNNGREAMKVVLEEKPDLIVSELAMTGMSGYELLGQVKADASIKDIPVILMSKYDIENTGIKSVLPGSIPVVKKDKSFSQILSLINEVI